MQLKAQDILVMLKLVVWGDRPWRQEDLAREIGLVQSQVAQSLKRAATCGLYDHDARHVNRAALAEILVHAIRFLIPARLGARARGMPTAWGHRGAFSALAAGVVEPPVWPLKRAAPEGEQMAVEGVSVEPLHEKAPVAAARDPKLYELLAAVDAMRVGRARDMGMARDLIRERLAN